MPRILLVEQLMCTLSWGGYARATFSSQIPFNWEVSLHVIAVPVVVETFACSTQNAICDVCGLSFSIPFHGSDFGE